MIRSLLLTAYSLVCVLLYLPATSQPPTNLTLLDDFTDGNFTANPAWTVLPESGPWDITSPFGRTNVVRTNMNSSVNPQGFSALSTPFTKVCNAWQIDFVVDVCPASAEGRKVEYYFLMTGASNNPKSTSGYKLSYRLALLDGTTRRNFLMLQKVTNGVASPTPIITYNNGTTCGLGTVTLTYDNGTWSLFVGSTLRGTGNDATYNPSSCTHQAIAVTDSVLTAFTDRYSFDNIKFREAEVTSTNNLINGLSATTISAFPNPTTDKLQISFDAKKAQRGELALTDMQGRIVYRQTLAIGSGKNNLSLNIREKKIQAGLYLLTLFYEEERKQTKLVIQ